MTPESYPNIPGFSKWEWMHIEWVVCVFFVFGVFFFAWKPWPLLHLINQLVSMAHLFYKLLLTYHMLSVRHDLGPGGVRHPIGNIWLVNRKCHKALQICIGWQMLEPDHPHIWKKYGLKHFLSNVFPQSSVKLLGMLGTQGMMVSPCCPQTCQGRSSLQLG